MDDCLDPRQPLAAAQRLERLPEVGQVGEEERGRRVRRGRLGRGNAVDVQHLVPVLEQVTDDHASGLAAASGDGDLHLAERVPRIRDVPTAAWARGAGPVDSLTTSSAAIRCCRGGGFCTVSCSISISAAIRPASKAGHSTPVSEGVSISANWAAITETIEKSSGTWRSAARSALSSPVNCQPVVIAAVHSGSERSSRAATANASRGRVRAGDVDAADAEVGGALLEDVARDQRRRVARLEQVGREVEERDAGVTEPGEVLEARLDRVAEVHVDVADPGHVVRAPDERERVAGRLEALDPGVVQQGLHQDHAVGPSPGDELRDRLRVGGGRREQERVVARARRLRGAGDERLLHRQELPLRRREEEGDRVRGAARESAGGPVRPVVELLDRRQDALAHLLRDGPLAAQDVRDGAQGDAGALGDLRHRGRLRIASSAPIVSPRARHDLDSRASCLVDSRSASIEALRQITI